MKETRRVVARAPETLETARLRLVRPRAGDAPEMFERYASDPEVTRYLGWPRHRSVTDTEGYVALASSEWDTGLVGAYLIRDREDSRLLGATGLSRTARSEYLTGYVLAQDAWGRGLATEALGAMVGVAGRLLATRIYALCHAEHTASKRVLEKCGFTRDVSWAKQITFPNLGRGESRDVVCFERRLPVVS